MEQLFSVVLNMSISGTIVILWVLAARLLLGRAPRVFSYCLWAVVLFRLLCPVSFTAPASALKVIPAPASGGVVSQMTYLPAPVEVPEPTAPPTTAEPAAKPLDLHLAAAHLWATGAAVMALGGILSYVNLKRRLRESAPIARGIREADGIATPFVLGLLRPVIYLPSTLRPEERSYILLHEHYHIRHWDPLVRTLFFCAVCLHWFHPLVWLAFRLCCRDMELRCDEAVLQRLDHQTRCDYAQSLLNMAAGRWNPCAPLAFGEGDTGTRVKHALGWKRKALRVLIPAALLCAVVVGLTACNPGGDFGGPFGHSYRMDLITDRTRETVAPAGRVYTLTEDRVLYIRDNTVTTQLGTFQRADFDESYPDDYQSKELREGCRQVWKLSTGDWWLLNRGGTYWMVYEEAAFSLKRVDLMGIVIREPGVDNHVQPYWCAGKGSKWAALEAGTWISETAEIEFLPEEPVDQLSILEERHNGTAVTSTNIDLPADGEGRFRLSLRREGASRVTYTVSDGAERYYFTIYFEIPPTSGTDDPGEAAYLVEYREKGAYIALSLPEHWNFEYLPGQGLAFWPKEHAGERLEFFHYPEGFGVCGTGLETQTIPLAGQNAIAGCYDGGELWSYITFPGYRFAVTGWDGMGWWSQFGDEAMEILNTAQFGETVQMESVHRGLLQFRAGGEILAGERDYMALRYPGDRELVLCEYTADSTGITVTNLWTTDYDSEAPIALACLRRENQWVYFGSFGGLTGGSFHLLLENGRTMDLILEDQMGFCFVCDAPMADFQLLNADHEMVAQLSQGIAVQELAE